MKITIEKGDESYRLVGPDGEVGDLTEYGEPATLEIGDDVYFALLPSFEEEYEELETLVYVLQDCDTEVVEVDFEEEENDESETVET